MKKKKQIPIKVDKSEIQIKDFFDMIAPSVVKFMADYFIFGDTFRCVWAIREYPPMTSEQAILSRFGDKGNVTIHIYSRYVDSMEQHKAWFKCTFTKAFKLWKQLYAEDVQLH